jgi:hypothetical protein
VRNHPFSELAQNKLCQQIGSFPKWSSTWKLLSPSSPVIIAARQWPVHSCLALCRTAFRPNCWKALILRQTASHFSAVRMKGHLNE